MYLADVRKARVVAGEVGRAWRQAHAKLRPRIEARFDERMNRHGLRHARYWGLAKVTGPVLLNALTVNAKRAVKLLALRAPARRSRSRSLHRGTRKGGAPRERPREGRVGRTP